MDFFITLALLFSNAFVALWEEHQAGNEIAALKTKLANDAKVLRDGKWATPQASELVAGDVIRLRLGDIVPADARLTPLGWKYAGFVWVYAIVWALFTDRLKLLAYRILDPSALPLLAKKQIDLGPEISREAYELFQQRTRGESEQDQDWLEAERLVQLKHSELPKAS